MRRGRRALWWSFGAGVLVVLAALSWLTGLVLELERQEVRARTGAAEQERVRLALWRMDAWLGPHLAREAARPYFEYRAFYPPERAYTRFLAPVEHGEVLAASPLLSFESEFIRLHFQGEAQGPWTSPQVPEGESLERAGAELVDGERLARRGADLASLRELLDGAALREGVSRAEEDLTALLGDMGVASCVIPVQGRELEAELVKNRIEYGQRAVSNFEASAGQKWAAQQVLAPVEPEPTQVVLGPLVALWLDQGGLPELAFVRRVDLGARVLHQGFLVDWPRLEGLLLEQVRDLLPAASLRPVRPGVELQRAAGVPVPARGTLDEPRLASLPAQLDPGPALPLAIAASSPVRTGLVLTWVAGLVVLLAVGWALRAGLAHADERSRFASAVTHELRTPLTTFRMYSEMLAKGMVRGAAERREYLETLERESERLSNLVENVLSFARLEERRGGPRRERVSLGELLARHRPTLAARAAGCGAGLSFPSLADEGVQLETDPDAVGQILVNLVDNACKYGRGPDGVRIELELELGERAVDFTVRDHGPGIAPAVRRAIFRAFDRGGRDSADPSPGIGLGLALSRGLARGLGGELDCEPAPGGGARFRLRLPRAVA